MINKDILGSLGRCYRMFDTCIIGNPILPLGICEIFNRVIPVYNGPCATKINESAKLLSKYVTFGSALSFLVGKSFQTPVFYACIVIPIISKFITIPSSQGTGIDLFGFFSKYIDKAVNGEESQAFKYVVALLKIMVVAENYASSLIVRKS